MGQNTTRLKPSMLEERRLIAEGYRLIAGVDEVGRGALAGPVVAAAVIMPFGLRANWVKRVRDSKQLTASSRDLLSRRIQEKAISVGIGVMECDLIDTQGIAEATRQAMCSAIAQLTPEPQYVLIDYFCLPQITLPQKGLVDGDSICFSIACASIVAKVHRDHLMSEMDTVYPGYGFKQHKGYGTEAHLACLGRLGPCIIHRRSFRPVFDVLGVGP